MELGTNLTLTCMVVIFQINRVIGRLHVAVKKKKITRQLKQVGSFCYMYFLWLPLG